MPARLAVLASGRGSNLQAIIDAIGAGTLDAQIVGVFSDRTGCAALQRVPPGLRWSLAPRVAGGRDAFDSRLADAIAARAPDWVVCAGYMRILGAAFVQRFEGRILNIHPSLLPRHKGLHTHQRALDAGDPEHGVSVHLVTAELDGGPVIAQARVPVHPGDDAASLAERVLEAEHPLLLQVLRLAVAGRLSSEAGQVLVDGHRLYTPLALESPT